MAIYAFFCLKCGRETKWHETTHFHPLCFKIKRMHNRHSSWVNISLLLLSFCILKYCVLFFTDWNWKKKNKKMHRQTNSTRTWIEIHSTLSFWKNSEKMRCIDIPFRNLVMKANNTGLLLLRIDKQIFLLKKFL